jgi:hypothetical protein
MNLALAGVENGLKPLHAEDGLNSVWHEATLRKWFKSK